MEVCVECVSAAKEGDGSGSSCSCMLYAYLSRLTI